MPHERCSLDYHADEEWTPAFILENMVQQGLGEKYDLAQVPDRT